MPARGEGRAGVTTLSIVAVATAAGGAAWVTAQLGLKGVIAASAAVCFVAALVVVRRREDLILGLAVLSIAALLHKSFGSLAEVSSGPPSIYVSSFDVMVFLLWFAWLISSPQQMAAQLRGAFRNWVLWAPIAAFVLMLPSVLTAPNTTLAVAEIVRMGSAYLAFVYFAVRLTNRRQVLIVLGALGVVACLEAIVVLGQRITVSALGLSVFGTPTILTNRDDGIAVARPFGTMAHPVFLAAFTGAIALLAFALAVTAVGKRRKALWLVASVAGVVPLLVSNARSASLALVVAFVVLSAALLVTHRLPARTAAVALLVGCVSALPFLPYFVDLWNKSVGNSHFSLEWESRMQLNEVAVAMFEDSPFFGHGLNNFEQVMDRYDTHGLIFADNPVHNIYLLQLSETGLVGFVGMLVMAVAIVAVALRVAASRDRLYSAVGFGVAAVFLFWAIEEMFVFSLRQDHPRVLLFVLSGVVVACARLAAPQSVTGPDAARAAAGPRPAPTTGGDAARAATGLPSPRRGLGQQLLRLATRVGPILPPGVVRRVVCRTGRRIHPRVLWAHSRAMSRRVSRRAHVPLRQVAVGFRLLHKRTRRPLTLVVLSVFTLSVTAFDVAPTTLDRSLKEMSIVFSAIDRSTGLRGIYTVSGDGTNLRRVSPDDGRNYSWPAWAFGGSKIVFTARNGPPGGIEPLYLMDADGSHIRQLTTNAWRNAQPHVTNDGRSLVFTSFWDEYPKVAIYRMDLATGLVRNISAVGSSRGAFDSDPRLWPLTPEAGQTKQIYFVDARHPNDGANRPGEIAVMNIDGTQRRTLTRTGQHNTDPGPSPDGTAVAIARYVGAGTPQDPDSPDPYQAKLENFVIINHDVASGAETQLTGGRGCFRELPGNECGPADGSAYLPQYSADGEAIAYLSILSSRRTCICVVTPDGSGAQVAFESDDLAINEFDWIRASPAPAGAVLEPRPSGEATTERLLVTSKNVQGDRVVAVANSDLWGWHPLPVPAGLSPSNARWGPDMSSVYLDARFSYDRKSLSYGPEPPGDTGRVRHYTLDLFQQLYRPERPDADRVPRRQVWELDLTDLTSRKLTTPGTEDWRDAIPDGEARGNIEPSVSPDGRYVIFTNVSQVNDESFILRLDRRTGEVLSLTNATAGAMPVGDGRPTWSPDGTRVAFSSRDMSGTHVWVMDADGYHARRLTDDRYTNLMPTWSPDGRYVVYSSYRGKALLKKPPDKIAQAAVDQAIDLRNWVLVRVDLQTGKHRVLTRPQDAAAFGAVYSKDGSSLFYIGVHPNSLNSDVWTVPASGGVGRPVQITVLTSEISVDVR